MTPDIVFNTIETIEHTHNTESDPLQTDSENITPKPLRRSFNLLQEQKSTKISPIQSEHIPYNSTFFSCTAYDLIKRLQSRRPIVTLSRNLDYLLGGGIFSTSGIYEFNGGPGEGKSQLCMQLAVNIQIPQIFYGQAKHSIYIDTEGGFSADRCYDLSKALIKHLQTVAECWESKDYIHAVNNLQIHDLMKGIYVFRVYDEFELFALILNLETLFLKQHPRIGLILLDSLSFPFRSSFVPYNAQQRLHKLVIIADKLNHLALHYDLAIVLTNQMTQKFILEQQPTSPNKEAFKLQQSSVLIPCLGSSWEHIPSFRLTLSHHVKENQRICKLMKSNGLNNKSDAIFEINECGIRDPIQD